MKQLRETIRRILLAEAVEEYACLYHSAGFIDAAGKYIAIDESHEEWLVDNGYVEEHSGDLYGETPENWLYLLNAKEMKFYKASPNRKQVYALIDFWVGCAEYRSDMKNVENFKLEIHGGVEEITWGSPTIIEFLEEYENMHAENYVDTFFEKLL